MRLSRFRFLAVAVAGWALFASLTTGVACRAQDTATEATQAAHEADYFLRHGKNFDYAIAQARVAVHLAPTVTRYHATLACALASRAASIALAQRGAKTYAENRGKYERDLALWRKAQQTGLPVHGSTSQLADMFSASGTDVQRFKELEMIHKMQAIHDGSLGPGTPEPRPPVLLTRDDGKAFDLIANHAAEDFARLDREARQEFIQSVDLSVGDREKAEAFSLRAWGNLLLQRYYHFPKADPPATSEAIQADITQAVTLEPKQSVRWQELGDILVQTATPENASEGDSAAVAAYRNALSIDRPDRHRIALRLFSMLWLGWTGSKRAKSAEVLERMQTATRTYPDDPYALYYSALLLLNQNLALRRSTPASDPPPGAEDRRPLQLAEQANTLTLRLQPYQEATPRGLAAAWSFGVPYGKDDLLPNESVGNKLGQLAYRLLDFYAPEHGPINTEQALRATIAVLSLGDNLRQVVGNDPFAWTREERNTINTARGLRTTADNRLLIYYDSVGDRANFDRVTAELAEIKRTVAEEQAIQLVELLYGYQEY